MMEKCPPLAMAFLASLMNRFAEEVQEIPHDQFKGDLDEPMASVIGDMTQILVELIRLASKSRRSAANLASTLRTHMEEFRTIWLAVRAAEKARQGGDQPAAQAKEPAETQAEPAAQAEEEAGHQSEPGKE
jgi:hypothetical protein